MQGSAIFDEIGELPLGLQATFRETVKMVLIPGLLKDRR
jgi:hypothetical protein